VRNSRPLRITLGILGWVLAIGGGLVAGLYSSDNTACGTSAGVTVRSLSQTAQNSCVLYGTLWTLGIVLAVVGIVMLAGWIALLVKQAGDVPSSHTPTRAKPGWYRVPELGGRLAYWNGKKWIPPDQPGS
jgi:hypothetical protein